MIKESNMREDTKCYICDKNCFTKFGLESHNRIIHDKTKDQQCIECDRRFVRISELIRHITYEHSIDETIKCEICEQKFFSKYEINEHSQKHYNEKGFKYSTTNGGGFFKKFRTQK